MEIPQALETEVEVAPKEEPAVTEAGAGMSNGTDADATTVTYAAEPSPPPADGHGDDGAAAVMQAVTDKESGGAAVEDAAEDASATTNSASLFDYAMASSYNTAGTDALVTSVDMTPTTVENADTEGAREQEALAVESTTVSPTGGGQPSRTELSVPATSTTTDATLAPTTSDTARVDAVERAEPSDKKTGRPSHPAWDHFVRGSKRNRFHHNAYCKYCSANGVDPLSIRGVSGNMIRHLQKCMYCPEEIVKQLRIVCAQKDAVNFNKRHHAQPKDVEVSTLPAVKKIKKSSDNDKRRESGVVTTAVATPIASVAAVATTVTIVPASSIQAVMRDTSSPQVVLDEEMISTGLTAEVISTGVTDRSSQSNISSRGQASPWSKSNLHRDVAQKKSAELEALMRQLQPSSGAQHGSATEIELNRHFLKATLSSGLPLDWTSMEESAKVFGRNLPTLSNLFSADALNSISQEFCENQGRRVKEDSIGVTLSINSWQSKTERTNLVLFSVINALGETCACKLIDVGMENGVLDGLSSQITHIVTSLYEEGVHLIAIVADSLLACAAARAAVAAADDPHPPVAVLPSFETFLTNALGVILTINDSYVETMGKVIEVVRAFNNNCVRDCLRQECGDADATLVVSSRENWYSFIECIDSVRQYEDTIKIIAIRASTANANDGASEDSSGVCAILSSEVLGTIQNSQFWEMVVSMSELMSPIKETYRLMHPTTAAVNGGNALATTFTLSDVFYQLGRMHQQYSAIVADWEENPSSARMVNHVRYLQEQVDKTWKLYDQPLMFLAYTFNYNMVLPSLPRDHVSFQWLSIGKYAKEYFRRWFCGINTTQARSGSRSSLSEDGISQFIEDVLAFKERKHPFDTETVCEFETPRTFYQLISDSNPLMHQFGARLFSFATSVPPMAGVVPGMCSVTRKAFTACAQESLFPLLQSKLYSRTSVKPSKELVHALFQSVRARRQSMSSTESSLDKSWASLLEPGVDHKTASGIWSASEWRLLAKEWKQEWEQERDVGHVLTNVAGLGATAPSRLTAEILSLDQIFKDKLPSRLQQNREEAVVDV